MHITKYNDNTNNSLCRYRHILPPLKKEMFIQKAKLINNLINVSTILLRAESFVNSENLFLYVIPRHRVTIIGSRIEHDARVISSP